MGYLYTFVRIIYENEIAYNLIFQKNAISLIFNSCTYLPPTCPMKILYLGEKEFNLIIR